MYGFDVILRNILAMSTHLLFCKQKVVMIVSDGYLVNQPILSASVIIMRVQQMNRVACFVRIGKVSAALYTCLRIAM